ncbi:MAG TPA: hypothetical protein PLM35_05370, partial [Cyclobacteriaceae bacterium]|nr:hypothetical protein [Cyclobacteriaceae bacterium]
MKIRFLCLGITLSLTALVAAQDLNSQNKADRFFDSGLDLMAHGEYGAAKQSFADFLRHSPASDLKRAEAGYYQAFCALNLYHGDGEKMIEE